MKMFVKGISMEDFSENWVGRRSNISLWMRTMTVLRSSPTNSTRRVVQYFLPNFGSEFSRTKSLCFENWIFLPAFGLDICEGVGEDSRYGIGHVDIRVGSCNCLNVFVCHACALRWGIT